MRATVLMQSRLFGVLLASVLVISGCASQRLNRQDYESIKQPMSVVWLKTPNLRAPTVAGLVLTMAGGIATAPVGVYMNEQSTKELRMTVVFPDIGFEVASRVMSIWREKGAVHEMVLLQSPIEKDHKSQGPSMVFEIIEPFFLGVDGYLVATCRITMKDNFGKTIYKSKEWFNGFSQHRKRFSRKEFKADNGRLLIEEMEFASQHIADNFVKNILVNLSK